MFDWHLRQEQAAMPMVRDQQPVPANLYLLRLNRSEWGEDAKRNLELRRFLPRQRPKACVLERCCTRCLRNRLVHGCDGKNVSNATSKLAANIDCGESPARFR